jgi:signal peptidase I
MSDDTLAPAAPRPETRPRSPILAALVSLLVPGLGHVYGGRPARGLAVVLGFLVWSVVVLQLTMAVPVHGVRIALLLLLPLGRAFVAWDAARVTWPVRKRYVLRGYNRWYVYALVIVAATILGEVARAGVVRFVARAFSIPTATMEPSLLVGDHILMSPGLRGPIRHGDIVGYGDLQGQSYIHRVVAGPSDVVGMRNKVLWLNGRPVREPYAMHLDSTGASASGEMSWQLAFLADPAAARGYAPTRDDWGPLRVPAGQYLMLGDNRDNSLDGRWRGFVPREEIRGRPVWIYFSRGPGGPIRWERSGGSVH